MDHFQQRRSNESCIKLGIISSTLSAGGGERFLHGLVGGMLTLDEMTDWCITVVLPPRNTAGAPIAWPSHLRAPNLSVKYLWADPVGRVFHFLNSSGDRLFGIPGTSLLRYYIPHFLVRHGPRRARGLAGDARIEVEFCCEREGFDVIYFPWPYDSDCPRTAAPLVMTPHDLHFRHGIGSAASVQAKDGRMRDWLAHCAAFVVSTNCILDEFRGAYPRDAPKGSVIRAGIPTHPSTPDAAACETFRRKRGLPAAFLLTAGWITPHKNQHVLFEAIGRLRQRGIGIPVVCVGPNSLQLNPESPRDPSRNPYIDELLGIAQSLGLELGRDFYALGYVTDSEMECLYRLATALVMPTLYEGGGLPVIEAVKAGCPVLCSNIPPLVEELDQVGRSALLFDPRDADALASCIEQALNDSEGMRERTGRGQELTKTAYDWERTAAAYLGVFRQAAALEKEETSAPA